MKDISNIIKEFEKLPYMSYVRKRNKHEPTDSYFYLAIKIAKCMMRVYAYAFHVDPVRTKISGMKHIQIMHIYDSDKSKSTRVIADKTLSQVYSTKKENQKALS